MQASALIVLALSLGACGAPAPRPSSKAPFVANQPPPPPPPQRTDIDSADILARTVVAPKVLVKHVLVAWADLAPSYIGPLDPRAAKRTQAEAANLALDVASQLRTDPTQLDGLMAKYSEDPGSLGREPYAITPETPFVPGFKQLGLRLELGEVGIVRTRYGYHVMIRVPPPPPDPLESADILARSTVASSVEVQHILIGWEGLDLTRDEIVKPRTKAQADALAGEVLAKVRAGGDMTALMRHYSEDRSSNASARRLTIDADTSIFDVYKALALRLDVNEAGLVKTPVGWHIIKRVPPPPPDPLDSVAILQRTSVAERVKVKHILLGWDAAHADDPRGKKRTRAQLEKLVKTTLKRLAKKGANMDALMAELSEDPASAKTGEAYEVMPDTPMVKPFLNMSLRLLLGEVAVVRTEFGIHIIKRVE